MLRSNGAGVLVNKGAAPASIALFQDDLIETQKGAATRIESTGSTAEINPETMVQFEGDELVLDHGSLAVNTSRGIKVRVGCVTITPVKDAEWTHYEVVNLNGKITVSAQKSDVYIDARSSKLKHAKQSEKSERSVVHETEQSTREEKCGGADARSSGSAAGAGAILNSARAVWVGAAVVGGLTCWAICRGDDPISPAAP